MATSNKTWSAKGFSELKVLDDGDEIRTEWWEVTDDFGSIFRVEGQAEAMWLIDVLNAFEKDFLQGSSDITPKGLFNGP